MRLLAVLGVLAVTACASAPEAPQAERQVPLDSTNIVEAQKAGYTIRNEDGKTLYCKKDPTTGSHVRKTVTCLSEAEWDEMRAASRRGVEAMRRDRPPMQGK